MIKGGSSRKLIFMWNFSGTPWGGTCDRPGQTISFISSPFHVFHVPIYIKSIYSHYKKLLCKYGKYGQEYVTWKCVIITSSQHFPFTILDLQPNGLKFMTLSSASLKYPSVLKILFLSLSLEVSAVPPLLEICCFILCLDMKFWFRLSLFWCFCSASLFDLPLWPWPFNLIFNKWR